MKNKIKSGLLIVSMMLCSMANAQVPHKDKAFFKEYQPGYYQNYILKGIEDFNKKDEPPKIETRLKMDFSGMSLPNDITLYKKQWYNDPVSQGNTGTCWCFSTTSYLESEIYRLSGQQVKLSEMYTVYWEYVEKAKYFIKTRGTSAFAEGSEANAVTRMWKLYGIVPLDAYNGMMKGQSYHDHSKMFEEMNSYLQSLKNSNAWNEELTISTIKSILNNYMGVPPAKVNANGREMTPQEYLKDVLKLNPDDFCDVTSLYEKPYYTKVEYKVPDNWWHSADYYNLPLDDYMKVVKNAIRKGYTVAIGGDVSEAGFEANAQIAMIPTFDVPSEYIDEYSRQFRFSNKTTTDDHGLHIVGYVEKDGKDWYLVKDSGSGSRNVGKQSKSFGFYFFHEDYVKLKIMDFMIHKDMMKDYLPKFK
ncbi:MAG TPA: C1 family peptidase [Bacteroidales bacterium]|nr:C1 family peptidase [Bacteroidales bacterium]